VTKLHLEKRNWVLRMNCWEEIVVVV
jgi:hypothetical protein